MTGAPVYQTPALVLSGLTMALGVVRALGEAGVPVYLFHYDERDTAQASKYVTEDITVANPEKDEDRFVEALFERREELRGGVIIPATDESLVAVSRHKQKLSEHYIVACPEWDVVESFIDKAKTYAAAEACGVPAPRTLVADSATDLPELSERLGFPMLVKPAQSHLFYSHFKRKMFQVSDLGELSEIYRASTDAGLDVMLQEIIPGEDADVVNFNSYVVDGECVIEFTARHIRNAPPVFGSPRVALSETIPEVVEPGRNILRALGFHGFACTEFKQDSRDGIYKLMEVNGRHNLSGLLAVRCGLNFPLIEYLYLTTGELPQVGDYTRGIYWTDVFRDAGYSLRYLTMERYRPSQYVRPYWKPHCDAILDRKDMGPFWRRLKYLARHSLGTAKTAGTGGADLATEKGTR